MEALVKWGLTIHPVRPGRRVERGEMAKQKWNTRSGVDIGKSFGPRVSHRAERSGYSYRTEETYVNWTQRFLTFAQAQRPEELTAERVRAFLERLAVVGKVSASTQNQALNALVFFFRAGLNQDLGELGEFARAKRPQRIPVVLTRSEVDRLFGQVKGEYRLMARLLSGSGLRLMECLRLCVKDVDLERRQIVVRDGSGFMPFAAP